MLEEQDPPVSKSDLIILYMEAYSHVWGFYPIWMDFSEIGWHDLARIVKNRALDEQAFPTQSANYLIH